MIVMMEEKYSKSKEQNLDSIKIRVTPPGPETRKVIDSDSEFLVTSTKSLPLAAKRAMGSFVEDMDGNVFLDFASGISVTNLGHIHPYVTEKVQEQLHKLWHFAGTDFYYKEQVDAARSISSITPGTFKKKVFFSNSGAESIEAAIKIAKIFTKKQQFISFIGGFHGRTQGALSMTASKAIQQKGFFPSMPGVEHVPYPNPFRNAFGIDGYEHPDELINRTMDFIEKYVLKTYAPPENLAAFLVEPIQGEGGYIIPPMNFHKELRKLADENNMLVIMDEVQSGMGRTGKYFASEHFGVEPEVITIAKAVASGIPMGAVVINSRLDFPESGLHSNTFGGNVLASVAATATIETMKKENILDNVVKQGAYFKKRLLELMEKYSCIGDVRGMGLMVAIDFVKDQKTREPDVKLRNNVEYKAFENGLITLSTGTSAVRLIPPLNIKQGEIDMGIEALEKAIKQSL
ncbi:MAG: acetyl ornithine aminotransferase family protein [Thermoplasmataceae archaeon]